MFIIITYIISFILLYFIIKKIYVKQLIYKGAYKAYNRYQKTESDKKLKHNVYEIILFIILSLIPILNIVFLSIYLTMRLNSEYGKEHNPYYIKSEFIDKLFYILNKEY